MDPRGRDQRTRRPYGFIWLAGSGEAPSRLIGGLAEELAVRIAIGIDTAQAIAREHHVAETLQRALLPEVLPYNGSAIIDAAYRPAAGESIVGGDWYDAFELPDGRIGISIGDVAGHGLSAAVVMGEARQAVRASTYDARSPGEVLGRANQMLRSMPMMVTALVGIFDPRTSVFTYASAGHPPPLVITPDGHAFMLPNGDLPLGVVDDLAPAPWTFTLSPGTLLVLYTDGIVEFERDVFFGESALIRASIDELADLSAHPARSVQDRVFGSKQNADDVATMTLFVPPRPLETFDCVFSAVPFAAPFVRRGLERFLIDHGVGERSSLRDHHGGRRSGRQRCRARIRRRAWDRAFMRSIRRLDRTHSHRRLRPLASRHERRRARARDSAHACVDGSRRDTD